MSALCPERASRWFLTGFACVGLAAAAPSFAAEDDRDFELLAAIGLTKEDNIFRLPEAAGPQSDSYRTATAGFSFRYPVSAQVLVGEARASNAHFSRFDELDHDAWALRGAWLWRAGSRLDGQAGVTAQSVLASFANLSAGEQSDAPNELRIWRFDADGGYDANGRWQLRAAFNRIEHRNSSEAFATSNMTRDEAGLSLMVNRPSGSRIGLMATYADASLPVLQQIGLLARIDNSHTQRRHAAVLEWVPTEKSRLSLQGGHVWRRYGQFPDRNFSSWMGRATYEWHASDRTSFTAVVQRDLSDAEQVNVGYVLARGAALRPAIRIGNKTRLALNLEIAERTLRGDLALGGPGADVRLREVVALAGADIDFQATSIFGLRLFGRLESRRANSDFPDYRATVAGVELRATF